MVQSTTSLTTECKEAWALMSSPVEVVDTSGTPETSSDFSQDRESVAVKMFQQYVQSELSSTGQHKTDVDAISVSECESNSRN